MTMRHGVFSGGDVVNGPATVVVAMKDAQKSSSRYSSICRSQETHGRMWHENG